MCKSDAVVEMKQLVTMLEYILNQIEALCPYELLLRMMLPARLPDEIGQNIPD